MDQSGFIVGIELGTSKIVGLLARRNEQGVISILAAESVASESSVKYGVVYNIDEAAGKVKRILQLLENKVDKKIAKAYFSVGGKSLQSFPHIETMGFEQPTHITQEILQTIEHKVKEHKPNVDDVNYAVVSPRIYLDGALTTQIDNTLATLLEEHCQVISGLPNIKHNIYAVARKAGIEVAGLFVGNITAAAMLLPQQLRQEGCALVDFGAGTTSVSIYKDGLLQHYRVIPFGGNTVTKDVQALDIPFSEAEKYKINYGKVGKHSADSALENNIPVINTRELNKIIQMRYDEIVQNVKHIIQQSGFIDKLPHGIFLTGMASQQTGLPLFIEEQTGLSTQKANPHRLFINNASELVQNPGYSSILSILLFGSENCEKSLPQEHRVEVSTQEKTREKETPIAPTTPLPSTSQTSPSSSSTDVEDKKDKKKGFFDKMTSGFFSFFDQSI